jgi:hypothetical protein
MANIDNDNIANNVNNVVDNSNIQEIGNNAEKQLKTDSYTLNAIKKYRAKNADKVKEYNKIYHQKKKAEKHCANPYIKLTKTQLYDKIFALEAKIKELEI